MSGLPCTSFGTGRAAATRAGAATAGTAATGAAGATGGAGSATTGAGSGRLSRRTGDRDRARASLGAGRATGGAAKRVTRWLRALKDTPAGAGCGWGATGSTATFKLELVEPLLVDPLLELLLELELDVFIFGI